MPYFDRERGEVVLRIIYDGLATAGKTANLRSLHDSFATRTLGGFHVPAETTTGRTLFFDWLELMAGHVDDWPLRCQLLTVPGQFVFAERRFHLLRELDAVVLVCESTTAGVRAARIAREMLTRALAASGNQLAPLVVQANKQDLPGALTAEEVSAHLGVPEGTSCIPACALRDDGVRPTFIAALYAARDRLRSVLRSGQVAALPPPLHSAEELYRAMLEAAEREPPPEAAAALDAALDAAAKLQDGAG